MKFGKTINEVSDADRALINLRCNNDAEMLALYSNCRECLEALELYATYYGREAGGKTLALYKTDPGTRTVDDQHQVGYPTIWLDDWYIYGSEADGRIATVDPKEIRAASGSRMIGSEFPTALNQMGGSPPADTNLPSAMKEYDLLSGIEGKFQVQQRIPDFRRYEIKDHLGNVRTVIADYKNPESTTGAMQFWKYKADVKNISNMYPYGKSYGTNAIYNAAEDYRYGFNGMEKERNIGADGSMMDFGARVYDSEFPSFGSPDPLASEMPGWSPYSFSFNNPILFVDLNGMKPTPSQAASMAWHVYDGKKGETIDGGWTMTQVYSDPANIGFKAALYTRFSDGIIDYALVNMGTILGFGGKNYDSMSEDVEQPIGASEHIPFSINLANKLVINLGIDADITFIGHSKGGAEAAANAVSTNRDSYIFNPAVVNLKAYGLDAKKYSANMTAFVVRGDPVSWTFPIFAAQPIDKMIILPMQSWFNPITNHSNFREALNEYLETNEIED